MGTAVRWPRKARAGDERGVHLTTARGAGRSSDARRRRQRGRCGHRHRDRVDGGGAGLQRHRLRRFRHRVGRSATARAERVGTLARSMDARVFRRRRRSGARLEFRHRPRRGVGVGRVARQIRKATLRPALRAGNLLRTQRLSAVTDDRGPVGGASAAVRSRSRDSPKPSCPTAEHRVPANWSDCPTTPPRSRRSPQPTARRSTAENWRPNSKPTRQPTAGPCGPATSRRIAPTGSAPSPADYRGYTVHEIPPNGQGIVALIALGILEHFDMAALRSGFRRQRASADRGGEARVRRRAGLRVRHRTHDGDARSSLLDKDYLRERATLIDRDRAKPASAGTPRGGTVYLTAADASGVMVSMIQSNYMGFGSGVVVPGTGIALQNRGADFAVATRASEPGRTGQAAVPHHHPGLSDQGRRSGDELRGDGRPDAAAGPRAGGGAHRRPRPESAGGLRRPAVPLGARPSGVLRDRAFRRRRWTNFSDAATNWSPPTTTTSSAAARRSGGSTTDIWRSATLAATARRPASRYGSCPRRPPGRCRCESGFRAIELIRGSRRRLTGPRPNRDRCPPPTGRGHPRTRSRRRRDERFRHAERRRPPIRRRRRRPVACPDSFPRPAPPSRPRRRASFSSPKLASVPVAAALSSWPSGDSSSASTDCVSGSPNRQLNSMTAGPFAVIANPAYSRPEKPLPRRTSSAATGSTILLTIARYTSAGSHGSGAYAPMPPVLGPVSPTPTRLKSCAASSGTTVSPSTTQNSDTSGPSR